LKKHNTNIKCYILYNVINIFFLKKKLAISINENPKATPGAPTTALLFCPVTISCWKRTTCFLGREPTNPWIPRWKQGDQGGWKDLRIWGLETYVLRIKQLPWIDVGGIHREELFYPILPSMAGWKTLNLR